MPSEALRLLSGSSDEEKFAGLALLTKLKALRPDGSDVAAKNLSKAMPSLVTSIGEKFIRKLLLTCVKSKSEDEEGKVSNNKDDKSKKDEGGSERTGNIYGRLGVGFLSAVASALRENVDGENEMKSPSYDVVCAYLSGHADLLVKLLLQPSTGSGDENDLHSDCILCLTVIAERCKGGQEHLGRLDTWSVALDCLEKGDESESLLAFLKQLRQPEPKHLEKLVSICAHPATAVVHDVERFRLLSVWLLGIPECWKPSISFAHSARIALLRGFCCTTQENMRDAALYVMAILLKKAGGRWAIDVASDMNAQFLPLCISCACGEARIILNESLAIPHCPVERCSRADQVLPMVMSIFCYTLALLCEEDGEQDGCSELLPVESVISIRHSMEDCCRTILEYITEIGGEEDEQGVVDDARWHRLFQITLAALPAVGLWVAEDPEALETELVTALPSIVRVLQKRTAQKQCDDYHNPKSPLSKAVVMGGGRTDDDGLNGQLQQHTGVGSDTCAEDEKETPPEELASCIFRALWSLSPSSLEDMVKSNVEVLLLRYLAYFLDMHSSGDDVPLQRLPPCEPTAWACSLLVDLNLVDLDTTCTTDVVSLPPTDDNHELQKQSITFAFDLAQIVTRRKLANWSQLVAASVHLSLVCSEGLTEQYCSSLPWNLLEAAAMEALDVERFDFCELEAYSWSQSATIVCGEGGGAISMMLKPQTQGLCVILEEQWRPPTSQP